jgi:hypothetical protein
MLWCVVAPTGVTRSSSLAQGWILHDTQGAEAIRVTSEVIGYAHR